MANSLRAAILTIRSKTQSASFQVTTLEASPYKEAMLATKGKYQLKHSHQPISQDKFLWIGQCEIVRNNATPKIQKCLNLNMVIDEI